MPLPTATQYYTWAERMERSPLSDSYIFRSTSPARLSFESPLLEPSPSSRIRPASPRAMSPTRRSSPFMEPLSPMSPVTPLPDYLQPDSRPPRHFGSRDWESKDWKARSPSPARRHYLSELSTQDPGLSSFERSLADTYVSSPAARKKMASVSFNQQAAKAMLVPAQVPYSPRTPRPMSAGTIDHGFIEKSFDDKASRKPLSFFLCCRHFCCCIPWRFSIFGNSVATSFFALPGHACVSTQRYSSRQSFPALCCLRSSGLCSRHLHAKCPVRDRTICRLRTTLGFWFPFRDSS